MRSAWNQRTSVVIASRCEPMNSPSPECRALREAMRDLRKIVAQMRAGTHFAARQRSSWVQHRFISDAQRAA
jgi:hypothetical protein